MGILRALLLIALMHHSFGAEYDANKPITLTGTVTNIEFDAIVDERADS